MLVTPDGYLFTVYIEGVRFPVRNINISVSKFTSTASLHVFPHPTIAKLREHSLVAIFFRKAGTAEDAKLLFFGYLAAKEYRRDIASDSFVIRCVSRCRSWANILLSSAAKLAGTSTSTTIYETKGGDNAQITSQSTGVASITHIIQDPDNDNSFSDRVRVEANQDSNPFARFVHGSLSSKSRLKGMLDNIIKEAYTTSSIFNENLYNKRFLFDKYIAEMPGGWTKFFYEDPLGIGTANKVNETLNQELSNLGGHTKLFNLILKILALHFMDAYEIPGFINYPFVLMPNAILSDVPICNVLWPSGYSSIAVKEDDDARVTRLILTAPMSQYQIEDTVSLGRILLDRKATSAKNVAMYPDAFKFTTGAQGTTEAGAYQKFIFDGEEYSGPRTTYHQFPIPNIVQTECNAMKELVKISYGKIRAIHRVAQIQAHFSPWIVPGFQMVVNDPVWPIIGECAAFSHSISDSSPPITSITMQYVHELDTYEPFTPSFYDAKYKPEAIGQIFEDVIGCRSLGGAAGGGFKHPKDALAVLNEKYKVNTNQSYFIEVMSKRGFDDEKTVFANFGASANKQDRYGAITYEGDVFSDLIYEGLDFELQPKVLTAARRKPIQDYINEMYGTVGIKL